MAVNVNLDLVIPASIQNEFNVMRRLRDYSKYKDIYLSAILLSSDSIWNYAWRLMWRDIDRVILTFKKSDIDKYLKTNIDVFEEINNYGLYKLNFLQNQTLNEDKLKKYIKRLCSNINYSPEVLRTSGLLCYY